MNEIKWKVCVTSFHNDSCLVMFKYKKVRMKIKSE